MMHQTSFIRLPASILAVEEEPDYFSRLADAVNMFATGSPVQFKKIGKYFAGDLALFFRDFDMETQYCFLAIKSLCIFNEALDQDLPLIGQKFDFTPFEVVKVDLAGCDDVPELNYFQAYVLMLTGVDGERTAWGVIMLHKPLDVAVFACLHDAAELPYISTQEWSKLDHHYIEQASSRKFEYIVQSASEWLMSTYELVAVRRGAGLWETLNKIQREKSVGEGS